MRLLEYLLELAHRGHVVDDDTVLHRHWKRDHLPEVVRAAREDRQPACARTIDAALHQLFDPMQIAAHGQVTVGPTARIVQQHGDLTLQILVAYVFAAVNVEVTTRDRCSLPSKSDERTNHVFGDDGHGRLRGLGRPPMVDALAVRPAGGTGS